MSIGEVVAISVSPQAEPSGRRSYASPQRAAAAKATRDRIRAAATTLFLADGYPATSIRAIADLAGVAEKTVYLQFSTKSALLNEVVGAAIVGDGEAVAASERGWFRAIVDHPDPPAKIRLLAAATADLHERSGPVFAMARGAAAVDPEAASLWRAGKQGHLADMTLLADSFAAAGMIPAGLDHAWAVRTLYVTVGLETWHLIRVELDNSPVEYRTWLGNSLAASFGLGET